MRTIVLTDRQVFSNDVTATRAFLRCAPGVNQRYRPTSLCRFEGRVLHKSAPGYIGNALVDGLMAVLLHPLYVQVLEGNELIFIDQFSTFLVREVVAPVRLALVSVLQGAHGLTPFRAPFGQSLFLALQAGNVLSILFHPPLAGNLLPVGEDGKRLQPQVNTDHPVSWRQRLWCHKAAKASIPVAHTVTPNCQGLTLPLKRPVQLDFDITDFGKAETPLSRNRQLPLFCG